jgi:phenylacetic acid degradation operon negative regulatory protein
VSRVRNTRLTARSVLLSVLLGNDPPRLPTALLVRTTELFGIADGTTRTALSRMAAAGEVVADDGGYAIASSRLLDRQHRQAASRAARTTAWRGGRWVQAVVASEGRRPAAERAGLRAALTDARLAELREGVWLRPDNLGEAPRLEAEGLRWFVAVPDGDPTELAATLWDLSAWSGQAGELLAAVDELSGPLERGDRAVLADGFVLSAAVLRHLQADPLLPSPLLPASWPGAALRSAYERYDAAYRAVMRGWFRGAAQNRR